MCLGIFSVYFGLVRSNNKWKRVVLDSLVQGHEGKCKPTWINKNQVCNHFDGGITGFFKNINKWGFKCGEEFHGIILNDRKIYTTAGKK